MKLEMSEMWCGSMMSLESLCEDIGIDLDFVEEGNYIISIVPNRLFKVCWIAANAASGSKSNRAFRWIDSMVK